MQHLLFKVGTILYSIWKMAQLNKLREEKFFKNNQGTTLESRLQHYPKNICTKSSFKASTCTTSNSPTKEFQWYLKSLSGFCSGNLHSPLHTRAQRSPDSCSTGQALILLPAHSKCSVSLWCISVSTCHPCHLAGTHKCCSSAWMSLDTLGSTASFQVHFLKHVNSFFQTLVMHISLKMVKTNTHI